VDDAKKAELRRRAVSDADSKTGYGWTAVEAPDLLSLLSASDEAARLREENERLREALDAVANSPGFGDVDGAAPFEEIDVRLNLSTVRSVIAALSRSETKGGEE
jgi:hypothetical protein